MVIVDKLIYSLGIFLFSVFFLIVRCLMLVIVWCVFSFLLVGIILGWVLGLNFYRLIKGLMVIFKVFLVRLFKWIVFFIMVNVCVEMVKGLLLVCWLKWLSLEFLW